jgi:hypothetical protein
MRFVMIKKKLRGFVCEIWTQCVYCDEDTTFVCSVYMKFRLRLINLFIQKVSRVSSVQTLRAVNMICRKINVTSL